MKKIQLEIDNLVLHGFSYHDHRRISLAIEKELSSLIAVKGLPQDYIGSNELPEVNVKGVKISQDTKKIGFTVARSIYHEMSKQTRFILPRK